MFIVGTKNAECFVFGGESAGQRPVFYLPVFDMEEGRGIWEGLEAPCALACVRTVDWNTELTPWKAERLSADGEDFGGGADRYLELLTCQVIPVVEQSLGFTVGKRGLAGYSLAGLFAVYAMYRTALFDYIGSVSGSLWYDGFEEYVLGEKPVPGNPRVYLSLGGKEHRTGNPRLRRVRERTERLARKWAEKLPVTLEINPGGHFDDPAQRMARAIEQLIRED